GLTGRGRLVPGACADVLVFDPSVFTDHATFTDPARLATGLDKVIVNGQIAIDNDELVCRSAGRVLTV
ncbi:MAG: D-aminoacylase, partial [Clostridia bacterium]|nr:D-aminoacylase [Clostridia bacterium]